MMGMGKPMSHSRIPRMLIFLCQKVKDEVGRLEGQTVGRSTSHKRRGVTLVPLWTPQ